MQTLKEVFSRKEERQNLRNVGFSILMVVVLVGLAFGFVAVKFGPRSAPGITVDETFTLDDSH